MSWQEYVDSSLIGSGHIVQAAILGHDGATWASSADYSISDEEAKKLVSAFDAPDGIRSDGLFLAGTKFLVLRADERSIYGRKASNGVCCVKTGQAVLVGVYDSSTTQPGDANKTVEELADYLLGVGY